MTTLHQPEQNRFVIQYQDYQAVLEYRFSSEHTIDFSSTFVPAELRGKGLAEKLVRSGLSWAKEQDYHIEASCWYVQKFLR